LEGLAGCGGGKKRWLVAISCRSEVGVQAISRILLAEYHLTGSSDAIPMKMPHVGRGR